MRRVTLEVSLKPFWDFRPEAIREVCRELFRQWDALHRHADEIAILIWAADGSEILDYTGNPEDTFEWANVIGIANPRGNAHRDPEGLGLHSRSYLYRVDAPQYTYRDLARVVESLRTVGEQVTGKRVEIGATFDPGGEFAKSTFKYERHPEICMAHTMGHKTFVCCYAVLNADTRHYATFPRGIPQGTTLGTFLGRQSNRFMKDLGFNYLWLSNGFGFGLETWKSTGPMFDGVTFDPALAPDIREKILRFWHDLHAEMENFPIEVRGTNLGTGADLATDAVPLREIMEGDFGIRVTAPNSPWAAINGDFGVEMVGYMSRVAQPVAGQAFLYRYYVHDPWWLNSPWLDRYGREPHDIYLPLTVSRIDNEGQVQTPEDVALLTVDDSYGRMPVECPNEVTPHLLRALKTAPDAPGLVTWVYPYDRFHDFCHEQPQRLPDAYFHDWFVRSAINNVFPLNTVVSDRNFAASLSANRKTYRHTIVFSRVPDQGTSEEAAVLEHVRSGGRALLFGPTTNASGEMLRLLNLRHAGPIEGELQLRRRESVDRVVEKEPRQFIHRSTLSGGPITTVLEPDTLAAGTRVLASATDKGGSERIIALLRKDDAWNGGAVAWVRGSLTSGYDEPNGNLERDDPTRYLAGEPLLRDSLAALGLHVGTHRRQLKQRAPVLAASRHNGAIFFAGYQPDTTVGVNLATADGVPLFVGCDAEISGGKAHYRFPVAWHRECRVFLEQEGEGMIQCREGISVQVGVARRIVVQGLQNAVVRFLPEAGTAERVKFQTNASYPYMIDPFLPPTAEDRFVGQCLCVRGITGSLTISW